MIIDPLDASSMRPANAQIRRCPDLRLVDCVAEGQMHSMAGEMPAEAFLELASAVEERSIVVLPVLTNLFRSLRSDERIEVVHRIGKLVADSSMAYPRYRLTVKLACPDDRGSALRKQLAEALLAAYPGLHFEPCPASSDPCRETVLPYVVQYSLAGAIVTTRPAIASFERQPVRASANAADSQSPEREQTRHVWPFPGALANWPLSAPLYEALELPDALEVAIRVHGFSLDDETCRKFHRTLLRVQAGNLEVFHPESPIAAYAVSSELKDAAMALVRQWLRHPNGYAADCVLRSSTALGEVAQQRIVADVFGVRPFSRVRAFHRDVPEPLMSPSMASAIWPEQGIPALMPAQLKLHSLGVAKQFPPPTITPPQTGAWLGMTSCGHRSTRVALPADNRSRHVAIFGATGSGKSSLLTQMIAEDIADPHRSCGVGLIDPHGDLYQRVLAMIPLERAKDVILVDTSDIERTASLNPLEGMKDNPLHAQFVVSELISLIDMLFETKDSSGPMMRANLRTLLLLAGNAPERGTLLDAQRILEDKDYCDYVLSKCKDRSLVDYWRKFRRTESSHNGYAEWLPYIMARLSPFVSNPIMKRLVNRPESTIDLAQAMSERKIVLFNLSKGVLQDVECQVLGSIILMKFFAAAIGRTRLPVHERIPFHLYIDEFQTFATDSVPRLFSEARKFGLCLTTANQSLSQLNNRWGRVNIAESVLANTATKFLFRLGPGDTDLLRPYFQPQFDGATMATLPDFHAVACMSDHNRPLPPFVFKAHLAGTDATKHTGTADVVAFSTSRYTIPIERANEELIDLYDLSAESLGIPAHDNTPQVWKGKISIPSAQRDDESMSA